MYVKELPINTVAAVTSDWHCTSVILTFMVTLCEVRIFLNRRTVTLKLATYCFMYICERFCADSVFVPWLMLV